MNYKQTLDSFRPIPFYFLTTTDPAYYTAEAVHEAMKRMRELGFGGIVLFNKPPLGFDKQGYLSEFWFTLTGRFIQAARKLDLQLWINDGFNFPPGDAAGRIEAVRPDLKQHRLRKNPDGKLEVVEVPWGFPAFEEPESSVLFHKFVYEEYYRHFAPYFGNGITGFFSDADNRRVNAHTLRGCNEEYYPWCKNFPQLFYDRFHYRIEERLRELFSDEESVVKENYWALCGELYQSWFAANHRWCREHHVLYTFHSSDTGPLNRPQCIRSSAFTEGDPLQLLGHSDFPGTDHELFVLDGGTHYDSRYYTPKVTFGGKRFREHPRLNDTLFDLRAKYAASAAVLNGRERVMCEMFAATNWGACFNDLQRIAAWQIIQGINFIVPHAVHHTFRGETKFFAPPEFTFSTLQHGLKLFNDRLARWCMAATAGEYCFDYAVIDPTRRVWNHRPSLDFFRFCDGLNRRADGYIIVPEDYSDSEKKIVDPLEHIPQLPEPSVTFDGGELAFMRRQLDGEEYLLAANIWSPTTVSGNLKFRGKVYPIELVPGEIAIIGGPFESFRLAKQYDVKHTFDGALSVEWEDANLIPFDRELSFRAEDTMEIELLVPVFLHGDVMFNGRKAADPERCRVFGDDYRRFRLSALPGMNTVVLADETPFHTPALLMGNFDVEITTSDDCGREVYRSYCLSMCEPSEKEIVLSPRRRLIMPDQGWEKQGQPFYSGGALIHFGERNIAEDEVLEFPGFRDIAELVINGKRAELRDAAPYRFALPPGKHDIAVRCWNTFANRFERYAESSGLFAKPVIKRAKN